ncbi:MAG: hypothetical protein VZR28_09570 [Candidatus Cryptobacteroides sp.]|nr:hypothetical protein [Candidatus Cryptobacteroides sp.]
MARSRDAFMNNRLRLRDLVQVWALSLLIGLVLLALIILLIPSATLKDGIVYSLCMIGIDVVLLGITALGALIKRY